MTYHDDTGGKAKTGSHVAKPIDKRRVIGDCEIGDLLVLPDDSLVVLTAWISGGPFGRDVVEGVEGDIRALDPETYISRIEGYR